MKPYELMESEFGKYDEQKGYGYPYGSAGSWNTFRFYETQDCLVAYLKTELGTVFLIKGAKSYFAFMTFSSKVRYLKEYFRRIDLDEFQKFIDSPNFVIVNEDLYGKFLKKQVIKNLK